MLPSTPTLLCSNLVIACGSPIPTNPPAVVDACCTNVLVSLTGSTSTNSGCSQIISQTWAAYDQCCGTSNTCVRVVTVVDTTPPVLSCATNKTVVCGSVWSFDPPGVSDCCGTNVTVSLINSNSTVLSPCQTLWQGLWQATDCCSNSTVCTQWVTVVTSPYILTQPANQIVRAGQNATFTVMATNDCGSGLTYQWRWNGGGIPPATDNAYTRTNVQCADAGSFDVVVTSSGCTVTSAAATLTVVGELVITDIRWNHTNLMLFCGTGGCPGSTYCVLASTNVVEALANWVPMATNTFEVDGSFCVTNAVATNKAAQFFRLRAP